MGFTRLVTKIAAPLPKLDAYDRFLFIGPHPDDIEIGAGATAARLAAMGKEVSFLICTDGRFGDEHLKKKLAKKHQDHLVTPQFVADIRKKESLKAAEYLGVLQIRFLELSDGGFYEFEELLEKMALVIGELQPQVIFAPDPSVTSECHVDHLNVGRAARQLAYLAPYEGIMREYHARPAPVEALAFYMTAHCNTYVKTTGYLQKQFYSVKAFHQSQFPKGSGSFDTIELYLKLRACEFGLRSGHLTAEGFRLLGVTQMHCMPEAGD